MPWVLINGEWELVVPNDIAPVRKLSVDCSMCGKKRFVCCLVPGVPEDDGICCACVLSQEVPYVG